MTYEEILKHTRHYISDILNVQPMSELTMHLKCQQLDVVETIADALEKQILKKPVYVIDTDVIHFNWQCPKCKREYEKATYGVNYCPECGQALDWSE